MNAYRKAQRHDLARKVIEALTFNAVMESRFKDASYYYFLLSRETHGTEYTTKADLYYAYAAVYEFVVDPFTKHQPELLFQMSRYLVNQLGINEANLPYGISIANILYTLARQAMILGDS